MHSGLQTFSVPQGSIGSIHIMCQPCRRSGALTYSIRPRPAMAGGMKLSTFLIQQQLSPADFARRLGVCRMTVHRYIRGDRFPRPRLLRKIAELTDGQVTANDFLDPEGESPSISVGVLTDEEIQLIGRPLYPWSRLSAEEQDSIDEAYDRMMNEPPEGERLSPTLQSAVDALGERCEVQGDQFRLDGQLVPTVRIVREANTIRSEQGLPPLRYPGLPPPPAPE